MRFFERLLYWLEGTMDTPIAFGWFHWLWILFIICSIIILYKLRYKHSEKQLKIILGIYGITALTFEILKQVIWTVDYILETNMIVLDYQWYAFPFQLCTTPIFVSLICLFLKDTKVRKALLSYMAFVTILGSISTILIPNSCFTSDILVNIHTMWLHYGSFVVSVYLLMSGEVKLTKKNLKNSIIVFLIFVTIAQMLNIIVYNSGILLDKTFNMFYISPYFVSDLPIFDIIQQHVPYIVYFFIYILALSLGAILIFVIALGINNINKHLKK